eukprot:3138221-Lingulodinium_polyedra.AAC.1
MTQGSPSFQRGFHANVHPRFEIAQVRATDIAPMAAESEHARPSCRTPRRHGQQLCRQAFEHHSGVTITLQGLSHRSCQRGQLLLTLISHLGRHLYVSMGVLVKLRT